MSTIYIVCVVASTIAFVALSIQAVVTLAQIRHTAKAVEYLALNADSKLSSLNPFISAVKTVSGSFSSGWLKVAQTVYGLFTGR